MSQSSTEGRAPVPMYWGQAGLGIAVLYWLLPLLLPLGGELSGSPVDVDALLALGLLSGAAACSLIGLWRRSLSEKITGGIGFFYRRRELYR